MWKVQLLLLLCPLAALADDPVPPPVNDVSAIVAPKEASGTGKRNDPFVFDSSTKCVLRLTGPSSAVVFDLEDAPTNTEVIDRVLIFSLAEPGLFQVVAHGDKVYAKAWFQIKSGTDPPLPINTLAAQLRGVLKGAEAVKDAVQFAEIVRGIADQAEAIKPATYQQLRALMTSMQKSLQWPEGKYAGLKEVWRTAIPTEPDDAKPITPEALTAAVANMRILQKTAEAIANGK